MGTHNDVKTEKINSKQIAKNPLNLIKQNETCGNIKQSNKKSNLSGKKNLISISR